MGNGKHIIGVQAALPVVEILHYDIVLSHTIIAVNNVTAKLLLSIIP